MSLVEGLPRYPVDAHVHFHRMALVESTLDSAAANFCDVCPSSDSLLGTLLLAQSSREDVFERLDDGCRYGDWEFSSVTGEPQSMIASSGKGSIAVICGRQIRCMLGLEVLALGTTARYPDGCDLNATLEKVVDDGAIAVVPWGFGKWSGAAGTQMRSFFRSRTGSTVFAGDNGGRLKLWGFPRLLKAAKDSGFGVLPGSDPFPFGGDYRRVGAFGFIAEIDRNAMAPLDSLRTWLEHHPVSPQPYGAGLDPLRFAFNQCWIQVHKRILSRGDR